MRAAVIRSSRRCPGARVGRDLPHLHAGGTGRRDAHVRRGRRTTVRRARRLPSRRGRPGLRWRRRRRRERAPPRVARRALQGGAQARLLLPAAPSFFSGGGRARPRADGVVADGLRTPRRIDGVDADHQQRYRPACVPRKRPSAAGTTMYKRHGGCIDPRHVRRHVTTLPGDLRRRPQLFCPAHV